MWARWRREGLEPKLEGNTPARTAAELEAQEEDAPRDAPELPPLPRFDAYDGDRDDIAADDAFDGAQAAAHAQFPQVFHDGTEAPVPQSVGTQAKQFIGFVLWVPSALFVLSALGGSGFAVAAALLTAIPALVVADAIWKIIGRDHRNRLRWIFERWWLVPLCLVGLAVVGLWIAGIVLSFGARAGLIPGAGP